MANNSGSGDLGPEEPRQDDQSGAADERGQMRYQDPDSTTPREPTLAEKRARIAAEKRRDEEQQAEVRKTDQRRKMLVGGGVTVGVVALVSAFYTGAAYSEQKNAQVQSCTATNPEDNKSYVQPDEYCEPGYAQSHGGSMVGGMWMMPIFLGGGNFGPPGQYRYSYSPAGSPVPGVGKTVSNPNFTKPSGNTKVTTKSGSVVQRGGFGIGNKGSGGS